MVDLGVLIWQKHGTLCNTKKNNTCDHVGLYEVLSFSFQPHNCPINQAFVPLYWWRKWELESFCGLYKISLLHFLFFIIEVPDTVLCQAELPPSQAAWIRMEKEGSGLLVWQAEGWLHCRAPTPLGWQLCAGHNLYNHKRRPWHLVLGTHNGLKRAQCWPSEVDNHSANRGHKEQCHVFFDTTPNASSLFLYLFSDCVSEFEFFLYSLVNETQRDWESEQSLIPRARPLLGIHCQVLPSLVGNAS